jgi:hypothetical protein
VIREEALKRGIPRLLVALLSRTSRLFLPITNSPKPSDPKLVPEAYKFFVKARESALDLIRDFVEDYGQQPLLSFLGLYPLLVDLLPESPLVSTRAHLKSLELLGKIFPESGNTTKAQGNETSMAPFDGGIAAALLRYSTGFGSSLVQVLVDVPKDSVEVKTKATSVLRGVVVAMGQVARNDAERNRWTEETRAIIERAHPTDSSYEASRRILQDLSDPQSGSPQ